ncbi:coiled-coil family protein [Dictyostelium discoideum AX4]|uniref:HssA/B-like protein 50 n=1 Tax=Dictyostelium discoideum TaxID=44689 RepID=HSL50_DICDI|nr:coiled-coil family protein [Dictyostelium discoideum AX4]Q54UK8.1 RecName: Full=HssA/B-like protein 50 [Dictyostelium discoideum]EAL66804.1 coiled-coil family protein [Dictyostelium discoideum AX4]|eukprot:XP_640768.1 coiled-coil family protein [Dictyostelium discoideum AX4]
MTLFSSISSISNPMTSSKSSISSFGSGTSIGSNSIACGGCGGGSGGILGSGLGIGLGLGLDLTGGSRTRGSCRGNGGSSNPVNGHGGMGGGNGSCCGI